MATFCHQCGFQNKDNSLFCQSCGINQGRMVQPQQVVQTATAIPNTSQNCSICPHYQNGQCNISPSYAYRVAAKYTSFDYYKLSLADNTGRSIFPNLTVEQAIQIYQTTKPTLGLLKLHFSLYSKVIEKQKTMNIILIVLGVLSLVVLMGFILLPLGIYQLASIKKLAKKQIGDDNPETTIVGLQDHMSKYLINLKAACENGGRTRVLP